MTGQEVNGDMRLLFLILALALATPAESPLVFDRTVCDFGKVRMSDGPLECVFTVTNTGDEPLLIQAVVSSCGCTHVSWTRTPVAPGEKGEIKATYSNDEGPYPFDKTLTVYTSGAKRPSILHIRGVVISSKKGK